jgi:hypothetical protein
LIKIKCQGFRIGFKNLNWILNKIYFVILILLIICFNIKVYSRERDRERQREREREWGSYRVREGVQGVIVIETGVRYQFSF